MDRSFPIHPTNEPVIDNPWTSLRRYTDARIGLGRAGVSVPTKHSLEFQLAHAKAQDAVHTPLDVAALVARLQAKSWCPARGPISLHSRVRDRREYLQRPDYGRRLDDTSSLLLRDCRSAHKRHYDLAIAIVDGLSSLAIEENAVPFLDCLIPNLTSNLDHWRIAPLCIAEQGRVAIGDDIGELLHAKCIVVLIGERPGLSSPDSMGLYMTWYPEVGRTDAQRNCVSNIRAAGLNYQEACRRTLYLLNEARMKKLSGVHLKDCTDNEVLHVGSDYINFLTAGGT